MEVKGVAVKSIIGYIMDNHKSDYLVWTKSLSNDTQKILKSVVTSGWYEVEASLVEPTVKFSRMFFDGQLNKAAWELGRYSAEKALKGIYKIYVRASSPSHLIYRATRIMNAYYRPTELQVRNRKQNSVEFVFKCFDAPSSIVEARIGGWVEKALEISGCKNVKVSVIKKASIIDLTTNYLCEWSN